jgi:hypothetical protein
MKAEQRKELETNTLADKVGHAMQRVKGSSRRSMVIYFVVGIALLIALFLGYQEYKLRKQQTSMQWLMLDDGSLSHLNQLEKVDSPAGRSARLQIAWLTYWELGVRMVGVDPAGAMKSVSSASSAYDKIAKECKEAGDKIFEPQALLGVAVCEETLAAQDRSSLLRAKEAYTKLADSEDYKDSAEGKFAKKRLDLLNDKTKLKEMEVVYEDLQRTLLIPGFQREILDPNLFKGMGDKEKKKDD